MYDLIIIGGGPSGSAAGRISGKMGLETLLIEKEVFPRYKACGGALSEHAMSYLDFDLPSSICEKDVYGARVHYKNHIIERHKGYRIATLVSRDILDNYLLKRAKETGIEVKTGEKVVDFRERTDFVEVHTKGNIYKSKFAIVATGSQEKLKNVILQKTEKRDEYGICMVTEIPEDNGIIDNFIYNSIDIHFGVANMGYGWIFPHNNYYSVGVGGLAKYLTSPRKVMEDFLIKNGFNEKYKLKGHLIPAGGIKRNLISSRVLLSGDAAGFVDSFYGEGLAYAIRSGQIAAEVVSNILIDKAMPSSIKDYEIICKNEFGNNLRYSLILARMMHKYPGLFFKIFTSNEEVLDKYLEIPAMKLSYKNYIKWLIPRIPKYL